MAPKRKETALEKPQRLIRKGAEIMLANDRRMCVQCLKDPSLVESVKRHLISLGKWPMAEHESAMRGSAPAAAPPPTCSRLALTNEAAEPGADNGEVDADDITIHRNYHSWGQILARHMSVILEAAEPSAFSKRNLKALCTGQQREPPAHKLAELWGMCDRG